MAITSLSGSIRPRRSVFGTASGTNATLLSVTGAGELISLYVVSVSGSAPHPSLKITLDDTVVYNKVINDSPVYILATVDALSSGSSSYATCQFAYTKSLRIESVGGSGSGESISINYHLQREV